MNTQRRFRDWIKFAVLTGAIMCVLWLWILKVPFTPEGIWWALYYLLLFPGAIVAFPSILSKGHNFWAGWMVIGAILNWLLYTQVIYALVIRRRRQKPSHTTFETET